MKTTLDKEMMKNIMGGVSREEYCEGLREMIAAQVNEFQGTEYAWDIEQWESASNAYNKHCK
jgi:hypothetical protein